MLSLQIYFREYAIFGHLRSSRCKFGWIFNNNNIFGHLRSSRCEFCLSTMRHMWISRYLRHFKIVLIIYPSVDAIFGHLLLSRCQFLHLLKVRYIFLFLLLSIWHSGLILLQIICYFLSSNAYTTNLKIIFRIYYMPYYCLPLLYPILNPKFEFISRPIFPLLFHP